MAGWGMNAKPFTGGVGCETGTWPIPGAIRLMSFLDVGRDPICGCGVCPRWPGWPG